MTKQQKDVRDFHEKFNCTINDLPTLPSQEDAILRVDLIAEELEEFAEAYTTGNIVEVAKELTDILYVVLGAAVTFGIDLEATFDEVHRSNLSKLTEKGEILRNEAGKVLKPPTYSPANLTPILKSLGANV